MSFKSLKTQGSLLEKLNKEINKVEGVSGYVDERLWKPTLGKEGVGSAVIRFLPIIKEGDMPWAKVWSHAFQGPGGWYIENSLTTLNQKDPVSEYNRELWNSGSDKDKETVRKQKRKLSFYSNIYVVKDPANPQNEGRVFLYKYGKKIFDKVMEAMQPEFEDETPINPFDFWQGANFKLKLQKKDGYWNYDKSEFDRVSVLMDDDDALEGIWKKEFSLEEFTSPSSFKTYEQLEARLKSVLGQKQQRANTSSYDEDVEEEETSAPRSFTPKFNRSEESELPDELSQKLNSLSRSSIDDEEDDDTLSYFQKLADS